MLSLNFFNDCVKSCFLSIVFLFHVTPSNSSHKVKYITGIHALFYCLFFLFLSQTYSLIDCHLIIYFIIIWEVSLLILLLLPFPSAILLPTYFSRWIFSVIPVETLLSFWTLSVISCRSFPIFAVSNLLAWNRTQHPTFQNSLYFSHKNFIIFFQQPLKWSY